VATGQVVRRFEDVPNLNKVAFSPDGTQLATAAKGQAIKLWDVRTGQPIRRFAGNIAEINALAFTPDGRRLASTSTDGTVKLWDVATRQEALLLRGHTSIDVDVAFTPDGFRLATGDNDCKGKLWDARPWTPDAAIEREAVGLLDSLFSKPLRKADVIDHLQNAPTIRPRARQLALSLVDRYHEATDPEAYHQASWAIVRQPYLNAFQYRFALLQAEHARRLADDGGRYRTLLGAAQYRVGRYQDALATLTRGDQHDQDSPADLAFLVMAQHRLGHGDQARAALSRLRELVTQPDWTDDAEARDLLHEAEALVVVSAGATGEQ
jgi:WD domain, G-beta repeat